jgi:signal transduction histidine kinase
LLIGLAATLITVAVFTLWSLDTLQGLRQLQTNTIDRNRRDSLQLIRIQSDLNELGHAMRDMLDDRDGYGLQAWQSVLTRIREDLDDSLRILETLAVRRPDQMKYLRTSVAQFWRSADQILAVDASGDTRRARQMVLDSLQAQQASLTTSVARLLVQNNEAEAETAREIRAIYDGVERNVYLFTTAMLAATAAIGLLVAHYNRRMFDRMASLSQQRSTLARGLIGLQEEVFRSVSRELHDDFGQILTAVSAMIRRAEKKHMPPDSPLRQDLNEIRDVVQEALEKTRGFSQALHPTILDDYGLERAIERYVQTFSRQTGIDVDLQREGSAPVPDSKAIHVYRVLQEALNNVARHAKTTEAEVRLLFEPGMLRLEVEDSGIGIPDRRVNGLGLVGMRERAELMGGSITVKRAAKCGTLVTLEVPLDSDNSTARG